MDVEHLVNLRAHESRGSNIPHTRVFTQTELFLDEFQVTLPRESFDPLK